MALLSTVKDICVIGCANSLVDLQEQVYNHQPQVIVMDHHFDMGDFSNQEMHFAPAHVLILSNSSQRDEIQALMHQGIKNYISKGCTTDELIAAIYATAQGLDFVCDKTQKVLSGDSFSDEKSDELPQLSAREAEIVHLIAEGLANKEIAERLFLSIHTIKTHRKNIIKKLGFTFKNAAELATVTQSLTKLI